MPPTVIPIDPRIRRYLVWKTCPYVRKDGEFNPDGRTINDIGNFEDMANAVLYNSLAWVINGSSVYAENAVRFINTWFLDAESGMNPNLEFSQMQRGPTGQTGTHTGILYVTCVYIALRLAHARYLQ